MPYLQSPGIRKCFKMTKHMKISLAFFQLEPEANAEEPLLEWAALLVAVSQGFAAPQGSTTLLYYTILIPHVRMRTIRH